MSGMRDLANKTKANVDSELAGREAELVSATTLNWDELKPQMASEAEYEQLMAVVKDASEKNENLSQLITRLKALGTNGAALANKVIQLVK